MQYEEHFTINNPCNQKLTEDEYTYYMITHHEVAVYMSEMHLHNTKNPVILEILINVIRSQTYDINLLHLFSFQTPFNHLKKILYFLI